MTQDDATSFAPPPGEFPPTPRKVRLRRPPLFPVAFVAIFAAAGIAIIVFWLVPLVLSYAAIFIGATAPGEITRVEKSGNRKTRYRLHYTFKAEEAPLSSHYDVDKSTFDSIKVGDPITVRFLRLCPEISAAIDEPAYSRSTNDCCFTLFVLVWNSFVAMMLFVMLREARVRFNLAKFGTATLGRVANKEIRHGKSTQYIIRYRFRSADGAERESTNATTKANYDALAIGAPVTVLYNPEKPDQNVIYRFGDFDVIGADNKTL
jgi:hypothetical protein